MFISEMFREFVAAAMILSKLLILVTPFPGDPLPPVSMIQMKIDPLGAGPPDHKVLFLIN